MAIFVPRRWTRAGRFPDSETADIDSVRTTVRINSILIGIIFLLLAMMTTGIVYVVSVVEGARTDTTVAGVIGPAGPAGSAGLDGANGAAGSSGSAGLPGEPGTPGEPGADGQDGSDGSSSISAGGGIVDFAACDSNVHVALRSRLNSSTFVLDRIVLSDIHSNCLGSTVDVYVLGGTDPDWETLVFVSSVPITGETLTIGPDLLGESLISSVSIARIALEVR